MPELDPFAYFTDHASAIAGLGGENLSPDPRYCFHTVYQDVRPGPASFELQLSDVQASRGQLALRIHAFRPGSGENATLVAGARLDLEVGGIEDLSIKVQFAALRSVQYAFYGFFIEESDIHAKTVKVLLHEFDGDIEDYVEPPRSILGLELIDRDVRPANALIHVVTPRLSAPVSQDCTEQQIADIKTKQVWAPGLTDWAEILCLTALQTYGVRQPALEGLLVGACSDELIAAISSQRLHIKRCGPNPIPGKNSTLFGDFILWPEGLGPNLDSECRWQAVSGWFGRLKIGGVGIVTCRYKPSEHLMSSIAAADGEEITQNEIGKWALRLIADGYSVAPLAFSAPECLHREADGKVRFALIAQRL